MIVSPMSHLFCSCVLYLEQIYVFRCDTNLCQDFRNGDRGSNAHNTGSQACTRGLADRTSDTTPFTCDSYVDIFCENSKLKFLCLSSRHQQHGGSAVCDLTCVPSCRLRGEPVRKSRLDLRKRGLCSPIADTVVLGHSDFLAGTRGGVFQVRGKRHYLFCKVTCFVGGLCTLK